MKKKSMVLLASIIALNISSVSYAATLTDVPAKHWAYDSVEKLVKDGIVDGYNDNTFQGEKTLTRYEFAVAVAKAVDNYNKADEKDKSEILHLVSEFSKELNDIGARLGSVEQKVGSVKFSGDARLRYQLNSGLNGTSKGDANATRVQSRIRLTGDAVIDDNWSVSTRLGVQNTTAQSDKGFVGADQGSNNGQVFFDRAEFKYHKDKYTATIGRSTLALGQGLLYDFAFDGISTGYASGKLNSKVLVGDASLTSSVWGQSISGNTSTTWNKAEKFWATNLNYAFNNNVSATADVYQNLSPDYPYRNIAFGVNANIGEVRLLAEGVRNTFDVTTASPQKTGYWADLRWKLADVKKPGTWALNARYLSIGKDAIDGNPTTLNYYSSTNGIKGYELGWDYAFAKGAHVNLVFGKYKPYDTNYSGFDHYNNAVSVVSYFSF